MKYMLDIALVIGLLWIGYLWNGEKQNGLAQGDQIDQLNAKVAQLQLDLNQAQEKGTKLDGDLAAAKSQVEQLNQDLQNRIDALSAKTAEANELRDVSLKLKARVDELQGYKDGARKAIVAEMPKPAPAPEP